MKKSMLFVPIWLLMAGPAWAQAPADTSSAADTTGASATASTSGPVARAVFCREVTDHEPVGIVPMLSPPEDKVCFFTEIDGMKGQTITHRWLFDGSKIMDIPIQIGGDRWRCYSQKTLGGGSVGTWTVQVLDKDGNKLAEKTFTYGGIH